MNDFDTTVAMDENYDVNMEQPADDAQAAEVITAEDLAAMLMNGNGAEETAEDAGDGDQSAQEKSRGNESQHHAAKKDNQIRAALKQQRKTIFETELGESEETVRELIRAHKAAKLVQEDPDITPKAARKIVEAQEQAAKPKEDKSLADMTAQVQSLLDDGWTAEELEAFAADETAQEDMANGMSVRQAARAFDKRQHTAPAKAKKRGVPTLRTPAAGNGTKQGNLIESMSDEDFARFSDRAYRALMDGKKVTF